MLLINHHICDGVQTVLKPQLKNARVASFPAPGLERSCISTFSKIDSMNKIDSKVIWIGVVLGIGFGAKLCKHWLKNRFRTGFGN